jgi:hypothetical protein
MDMAEQRARIRPERGQRDEAARPIMRACGRTCAGHACDGIGDVSQD